jgi:hypothetical protein
MILAQSRPAFAMIAAIGGRNIATALIAMAAVGEKNCTTDQARMISVKHGIMIVK